jgi:hypothetical protein
MAINSDVRAPLPTIEYNKYVEIVNDTNFPKLSTTRQTPYGGVETLTFPKYAMLTYDITADQTNGLPFGDNAALDGFGKLRVTSPKTLFDAKQLSNKLPFVFDEVINGTATSVWQKGDSLTKMTTSAIGDYVIRQTTVRFNYQPGKSTLAYFTGVFTPQTNVIKRIGLFHGLSSAPYTPTDGIFIESTDGVSGYIAFRVLKTEGTYYALSAAQPAWNLDRLDGTGPSGLTINFNFAQLLVIDYEWLGVGRIRCGFNVAGKTIYAHEFTHSAGITAPYMTSGNQPVRYEIRQTGAGAGTMNHICTSVMSEGGEEFIGTSFTAELSAAPGAAMVGVTTNDTVFRPIIAVRLNPTADDLCLLAKTIHILNTGNNNIIWRAVVNPTITGGSLSFNNLPDTELIQLANGSASLGLSGGTNLKSGFANNGNSSVANGNAGGDLLGELAALGTRINGTPDILVIAAKSIVSASTVFAAIDLVLRS